MSESTEQQTCQICRRQFARYTCPSCNTPYCSLTCFRSNVHSQCSEGFYKKELNSDIKSNSSANASERFKMLEILKRFEEESANDDLATSESDDDENDLVNRLDKIDLDKVSTDELWELLTQEERKRFSDALGDPKSDLARTLLDSSHLYHQPVWWERSDLLTPSVLSGSDTDPRRPNVFAKLPYPVSVPRALAFTPTAVTFPVWNLVAILISYAYVSRHLDSSPLSAFASQLQETRDCMAQLVPFLTDLKSTTRLSNVTEMTTFLWSRFKSVASSRLFSVLLRDAAKLLMSVSTSVTPVPETAPDNSETFSPFNPLHPHAIPILALSDLHSVFSLKDKEYRHVPHKIVFYIAHVIQLPSEVLKAVSVELAGRASDYESEADKTAVHDNDKNIVKKAEDSRKLIEIFEYSVEGKRIQRAMVCQENCH